MNESFKRLFFDIEVSPNIGFFWKPGHKISVGYDNIIHEAAIICICYKYEGSSTVYSLEWNKGNDKELVKKFSKILNDTDEVVAHNGDNFDIKWFRTRCLYFGAELTPYITSIDTLKEARRLFRFNSNRLDYVGKYLGVGQKIDTGFDLWREIVLNNSPVAMKKMVKYCKQDVKLLEEVFTKMKSFTKHKTHISVQMNRPKYHCPECLSDHTVIQKTRYNASGAKRFLMNCVTCHRYFTVPEIGAKKRA